MNASRFHTKENKVVNEREGPCWYCGRRVSEGEGFNGKGRDVVWHNDCVGSPLRMGRDRHYDKEGFFRSGKVTTVRNGQPVTIKSVRSLFSSLGPWEENLEGPTTKENSMAESMYLKKNTPGFVVGRLAEGEVHDTAEAAWEKAEGRAQESDGQRYFVLQIVGSCAVEKPVVRRIITEEPKQ